MNYCCDILLIQPPHERRAGSGNTIPLGLGYLAAYLQSKGFIVEIIDCTVLIDSVSKDHLLQLNNLLQKLIQLKKPKFAMGIGPCMTSNARGTLAVAEICNTIVPQTPLIFGGPLASTNSQEWFFFEKLNAAAIIKGDGEIPLSKCLFNIKTNQTLENIEGLIIDSNHKAIATCVENIDSLPFPSRHLFPTDSYNLSIRRDLFEYPFATIMGSRGCPFHCPFCVTGSISKGHYRKRTIENIGKEVNYLSKMDKIKHIVFYDDQLFPNANKVNEDIMEFCDMMKNSGKNILWQVEFRPDIALHLEDKTIKHMYNSNCRQINFGIEKGYTKGIKLYGKNCDSEEIKYLFDRIHKINSKLRLSATFIIGGKKETKELIMETINFSKQINLLFAHFNPLELYPGTPFYQETFGKDSRRWFDLIFNVENLSCEVVYENDDLLKEDVYNYIQFAYKSFYNREEWQKLASYHLGKNFDIVYPIISNWKENRLKGFP